MNLARVHRQEGAPLSVAPSVNDNIPGTLAGHELSDLAGATILPGSEIGLDYGRFADISAFPECPGAAVAADVATPDFGSDAEATTAPKPRSKWAWVACTGSFFVHLALFYALAVNLVAEPQEAMEEAGSIVSVAFVGDAELDSLTAGDPAGEAAPAPEVIAATPATPVEVAATQPIEQPAVQPVTQPPVVAAESAPPIEAEQVATLQPQILTSVVPAEPMVAQPVPAVAAEPERPIEVTEAKPVVVPVEKPVEVKPAAKPPAERKPEATKPIEKPKAKETKEKKPKERKPKGSADGKQQNDGTRGSTDGAETAKSAQNGAEKAGKRASSSSGSAAVANYPGKVQAKIRRSVRIPSSMKRKHGGVTVSVKLTIGASGQLLNAGVARSSGVPELDQLAVDGVRRAAPFPPLPAEWGKSSWPFTQEVVIPKR